MERWPVDIIFRGTERFQLLHCLGEGGMGVVYEALDKERNLRVALKTLRSLSPEDILRFKQEFRALQDLHHPNLVSLDNLHEQGGHWFFTMELVEGTDFLRWVRGQTGDEEDAPANDVHVGFDEPRLRDAFVQLAKALSAMHAAGKVHRDVKPSNVRVTPEGRVVLLDFGLVTEFGSEEHVSDARLVGTTLYMAPEQAAVKPVGPEADWYALGVMLYEALTGRLPFTGPPLAVMLDKQRIEPRPPHALVSSTPPDLDALCTRLLAFDPSRRAGFEHVIACMRRGVRSERPLPLRPGATSSFGIRPPFVGRAPELAALDQAFEVTRRLSAQSVVVRGASGVGKSELVHEFTGRLRARYPELLVLSGRCYDRESVPYKAFDGAIDMLCRHLRKLDAGEASRLVGNEGQLVARLFPALSRVPVVRGGVSHAPEIPNPQELRTRAFAALRTMFTRLAQSAPLVLVIDDFQWADADSVALLFDLLRGPDAPPLLLLVTMRPVEISGLPDDTRVLELGALSDAESRELVEALSEQLATTADAAALSREAQGHPMFLRELVQHIAQVGEQAAGAARLEDALLSRIARLERGPQRLLDVLAVAHAPIPLRVAAQASALEPAEAARALAVLRVAALTRSSGGSVEERVEPYHDRIREAVLGKLDEGARKKLHAQLADALESDDVRLHDPSVLLGHLAAAGLTERAAKQAERAAHLASEQLAFDRAAMLYRMALALGKPEGEARRRIYAGMGDALAHGGRCAEATEAFFAAAEGAETATRLEYRRRAAEQLLLSGHVERGLEEIRAVLADMKLGVPRTPRGALFSLLFQRARLRLRGLGWKEREISEISRQDLERLELHKTIGQGLSFADTVRGFDFHARGLMLALKAGEPVHVARALVMEAVFEGSDGLAKVPRAERLLAEGQAIAERLKDPYLEAYVASSGGVVQFFAGRFQKAVELITYGEDLFRDRTTGTGWELNHSRVFLLHAHLQLGNFLELGARLDSYLEDARRRGDLFASTTMARSFNVVWLARNDLERARKELAESTWNPPQTGFLHLQHWFEAKATTELEIYDQKPFSRLNELKHVSRSLLMRPQSVRIDYTWLRGRMALADETPDLALADRIAKQLFGEGIGHARVYAELMRGALWSQRRRVEEAFACLTRAEAEADALGLALWSAVAQRRRGELLGGDEGGVLIASADARMRAEAIVRPDRFSALFAPGFEAR